MTQTFTLNYGLRWELYFPESVAGKGQGGLLDLNTGDVRIAGYGPYGNNLNVAMDYEHLAPRIGFAWQPHPNTVFRAGYGRTYGMGWSGDTFGEVLTFSYPTSITQNLNASSAYYYALNLASGPPAYAFPAIPSTGNYPLPNGIQQPTRPLTMRIPTLDSWNGIIQQQFGHSTSLQIGYVGSHGIHNMFDSSNQANPNQQTLNGFGVVNPATGLPYTIFDRSPYYNGLAQSLFGVRYGSPFGWTQSLRYNANEATTRYDALQVVLEKRFSQGFQLMANYTWSNARANESDYFFNNSRADYGNSYYNRRNVFVANGNWDLPFGQKHLIGGTYPAG